MGETCTYWVGGCPCRLLAFTDTRGKTTSRFMYFDLIIGLAVLVLFLWSCKMEEDREHNPQIYSFQCTHKLKVHTVCQQTADTVHALPYACIVTYQHIVTVWAQMQTHMLSVHRSQGVDGVWRLKVYCGWLANYVHIMRGSACQF